MAASFKHLSNVGDRTKCSVYGWIRKAEQKLHLSSIPLLVQSLCILYFREDEIFEIIPDDVIPSENHRTITKINEDGWDNNTYGIEEIPSESSLVCQWDLRIIRCDGEGVGFGISSGRLPNGNVVEDDMAGHNYLYWCEGAVYRGTYWREYGNTTYGAGDVVSMRLNLKRSGTIRFFVNGVDQGIAFIRLRKGPSIKYRLQCSLETIGNSMEVIGFRYL